MNIAGRMVIRFCSMVLLCQGSILYGESLPRQLLGMWTLDLATNEPAYMRIEESNGEPVVYMRLHVQGEGPHKGVEVKNNKLVFPMRVKRQIGSEAIITNNTITVGLRNGKLEGVIVSDSAAAPYDRIPFTGKKVPPMGKRPDLSKVKFGAPKVLFNGKDLTGWRLDNPEKTNGWSVEDGVLVNNTPKTDFSNTGTFGNLRTEELFEDFYLHIEFNADAGQNSGVYLRGMYEAQVVDRDSRMQGIAGVGSVFSRVAPTRNAATEPGTWQTYDLTLVDRHVTIILNGEKVVDNEPIIGPTGGAIFTDPSAPGPIMLQGDHTSIKYRNIFLAPVIED